MVFAERVAPNSSKPASSRQQPAGHTRGDLEEEFGLSVRPNEGEAANYGIYYDDSNYDYMQHMRDLGQGGGEVAWIEARGADNEGKKGKKKDSAVTLRDTHLDDDLQSQGGVSLTSSKSYASSLLGDDAMGSEFVQKRTYQDQQDVPDALKGFQPDMDPRLREVLEALEDDAYVDNEDEDVFGELAGDEEVDEGDWEGDLWEDEPSLDANGNLDEDEGWETDDTIKADTKSTPTESTISQDNDDARFADADSSLPPPGAAPPATDPSSGDNEWMKEFKKFKEDVKASSTAPAGAAGVAAAQPQTKAPGSVIPSDIQSSIMTGMSSLNGGRKKKRKGAMTNVSSYSMTSSSLARTDALNTLDDRFDKVLESYEEENEDSLYDDAEDGVSLASGMSGLSLASKVSKTSALSRTSNLSKASQASRWSTTSGAPQLISAGAFDGMMDDFLGSHSMKGKRMNRVQRLKPQSGLEQLDEIRRELGPARMKRSKAATAKS